MQGALVDTFRRFVFLGEIIKLLIPGKLKQLTEDTKTNERFSIDLVKRSAVPFSRYSAFLIILAGESTPRLTARTS